MTTERLLDPYAHDFAPTARRLVEGGTRDYYAYDLRIDPPRVVYIDPDKTVEDNERSDDRLEFDSFDSFAAARRRWA